jgi:hypothetical protein
MIAHPLFARSSVVRRSVAGDLLEESRMQAPTGPARYVRVLAMAVRWAQQTSSPFGGLIVGDNLLPLAGLWLRLRLSTPWVLLYSVD